MRCRATCSTSQSETDAHLISAIQEGNHQAFERLFQLFYQPLCHFVARFVATNHQAEDIVADLFLQIWRQGANWSPRGSIINYLYGAARKMAYKHLRRVRLEQKWMTYDMPLGAASSDATDGVVMQWELETALNQVIGQLPTRRKAVFMLSRYHAMSNAEIATSLGISLKTVENQMTQALRQIRQHIAKN